MNDGKIEKIADHNGGKLLMTEGKDLLQVLWNGADVLRGKMDANENKLKDSADYSAYKEENKDALPKFKFRKMMIDEFKNALMPKIVPLID